MIGKRHLLLIALAFMIPTAHAGDGVSLKPDTVLVKRGEVAITYADFLALLAEVPEKHRESLASDPQRIQQILEAIARRRLLAREARQNGLAAEPVVAARLRAAEEDVLASAQLNWVAEHTDSADYLQLAREYYLTNKEEFKTEPSVDVCHVLIKTDARSASEAESLAADILEMARNGQDFTALAQKYSEDPSVDENNGCFGDVKRGEMVKPFEEAAFGLTENEALAGPVKSRFGYHVIQLQEFHPAEVKDFEQVRASLVERMRSRHLDRVKAEYTGQLLRKHPPETDSDVMAALRDRYVVQPGSE